jgi:RNA polymerase-binding transcription factor DksA
VASTDEELQHLERHVAGGAEDAATATTTGLLSRLELQEQRELEEILAAERRIAAGTFGRCETCRRPIGRARLRAVPETRHCLTCQAREETRA